ncbi:MAG: insulinase family protein [Phycisphaerae bacterium]|nr:insulinase family protein [Phycisphaerae bacterium]NUQ46696.1 insulinase family protein [Phycisphaerae bacterium]
MTRRRWRVNAAWMLLAAAAAPAMAAERQYDFREKKLENGMRVITLEDHSCPIVAVQVWYHVGSKDEDPQRQGFAHMFEHMMFRGTDRLGPKDHFKFIRRTGGNCNAYTSFDNTTYVNYLPSNQLELALWLEAERMVFLKIDQESFTTERKVVEEERRLGLNAPYGTVPEKLMPEIFKQHPYRWLPIGQIPHLRAAKLEELASFWETFYVPNNATLVIVGDVKHDDAQRLAEKCFGWIPRCPDPPRVADREPPQEKPRQARISEEKGPVPIVGYVVRTVPQNHPDATALEALMNILGGGESSRLYRDLVKERKLCQAALAGAFALEQDGLAGAGAVMMPWANKDAILKEVETHIQKVIDEPVTERELTKVKNQMMRGVVTGALTVANKANLLGTAAVLQGDTDRVNKRLEEIRRVTIEDVQRVAKTYLATDRRTTVRIEPSLGGMLKSLIGLGKGQPEDEGAAEAEAPAGENVVAPRTGCKASVKRPEGFPAEPPVQPLLEAIPRIPFDTKTLPNGLKVVVVANREVPYVSITLGIKYGAWADDAARPGVASMTLSMLTEGTAKHTAVELAEEIEFNALTLGGGAGMDTAEVNATCLSDKLGKALELLAEIVQTPTFPRSEFDVLKQQTIMGLMVSSKQAEYQADRELRRRIYGDHFYARTPTGELEDVKKITPDDLKKWWKTFARPDSAVLYIAGDVQSAAAIALVQRHLGGWTAEGPKPQAPVAPPPKRDKTHIYLVDRPNSVQSQIRAGHLGITRSHPDYHASRVLSQIFGGAFDSRLNEALRVKKGLTYGARGGLSAQKFAGEFTVSTFSKTPKTAEAVEVMIEEIRRMQAEPPNDEEMNVTRSYLVGSFAGARETPQATVGDLWLIEYCGLPADFLQRALDAYRKATSDEMARIAGQAINPDRLAIVVVGDAKRIQADLEKIAPVTLVKVAEEPPATQPSGQDGQDTNGEHE